MTLERDDDACRRFSLPEFKRFGSFPDRFIFAGQFDEGIREIGNCVPPLFMRAIAKHICCRIIAIVINEQIAEKSCELPHLRERDF
jgi:DNA (cytosine-5)-methyltransferase 1